MATTASKGRTFVLQIGDGATSETFTTIGQFRTNEISINNEPVDITSKSDAGIRTLLDNGGTNSVSMSGSGVSEFTDTQFELLHTKARTNVLANYKLLDTDTGKYWDGSFLCTNLTFTGEYNGPVDFSCSFESSGTISYT